MDLNCAGSLDTGQGRRHGPGVGGDRSGNKFHRPLKSHNLGGTVNFLRNTSSSVKYCDILLYNLY